MREYVNNKKRDQSIIGDNVLIVADSMFELFNTICFVELLCRDKKCTLIITDNILNAEYYVGRARKCNMFTEVFYYEASRFPYNGCDEMRREELKSDPFEYRNEALNKCKELLSGTSYDTFVSSEVAVFSRSLYSYLNKEYGTNGLILGEGLLAFYGLNELINSVLNSEVCSFKEFLTDYEAIVVFNEKYVCDYYNAVVEMPPINRRVLEKLNLFFDYKKGDYKLTNKIIVFESSHVVDGVVCDEEIVKSIIDRYGQNRVAYKMHPRNKNNRFSDYKITFIPQLSFPWELLLLNEDCTNCEFISVASGCVFNPYFWLGRKEGGVLLHDIVKWERSTLNALFDFYIDDLSTRHDYFVPCSQTELFDYLDKKYSRK